MVADQFGQIIEELGRALEMKNLAPDENNTCLLRFPGDVEIYIEMDRDGEHLLIGCDLGELPPGRYRENLFEAALISNNNPPPIYGILGYSKQAGHLAIYDQIKSEGLKGEEILEKLMPFIAKAKKWKEAIDNDRIPDTSSVSPNQPDGIFGLQQKNK